MSVTAEIILKNGTIVNQNGIGIADIAIKDGKISAIGTDAAAQSGRLIDCKGLHILPGIIDSQVHFREPGAQHKEDLVSGSRAAIMGGVTCIFEMPNSFPPTTSQTALEDKLQRAHKRLHCDYAFYIGATADNIADLPALERLPGSAGIKIFMGSSTGDLLIDQEEILDRILATITRRAAFHSEDEQRLKSRADLRQDNNPSSHATWRDAEAARLSTSKLLQLARRHGKRVHVLHVSTKEELPLLAANRDIASSEVTPHHLSFSAADYDRLGTLLQMNPPIRDKIHGQALWQAINSGLIDILGSDHAPHTLAEKAKPYPHSPSGMPGVQTFVPIMLDHVRKGHLSLERFVDLTAHGPARIFGIANKGRIAVGYDADLTLVDFKSSMTIKNDWIESLCGWTPYDQQIVANKIIATFVRGTIAMWENEISAQAHGEPARFLEAL